MSKRPRRRVYVRSRGGTPRFYADFLDYADVGGDREALLVPATKRATTDPAEAETLAGVRLKELQELRLRKLHGLPTPVTLAVFAQDHLVKKARAKKVTDAWLEENEHFLNRAVAYFGSDRELASITPEHVAQWAGVLLQTPATRRRAPTMSPGTVRHHLNALSNLYRRAQAEGRVAVGYNPVAAVLDKPTGTRDEAAWLEMPDAALFLEAARLHDAERAYPLVATFLLTGGRESEILGLEIDDVSLARGVVTFRPNAWRRLKTATSHRSVPLMPQLKAILRAYFPVREQAGEGTLLFPSFRTGKEAMVNDFRKLLDAIAERAGWRAGEIRTKAFRHTYITARLQTLDRGAPVSVWTVAREVGHKSTEMIERIYGHLGTVRHRSKVVEYRVSQHKQVLRERLAALRSGTVSGTVRKSTT